MDVLTGLLQGNNWIIVLLAVFLFKDQLIGIFTPKPKPVDPNPPVVSPTPPAPVITIPADHPLIDVLVKDVLPVLLPLLVNVIKSREPPK